MKTMNANSHRRFLVFQLAMCLILITVAALPTGASAAGLYTHSYFVERAIQRLTAHGGYSELVRILDSYPGIVNYGAILPDITYGDIDNDWAESLHDSATLNGTWTTQGNYSKYLQFLVDKGYDKNNSDLQTSYYKQFLDDPNYDSVTPPFRAALMSQILGRFKNSPRSVEDEETIAFLFGVIAHQEADIPWHYQDPNWPGLELYVNQKGWFQECGFPLPDSLFLNSPEICIDVVLRSTDGVDNAIDMGYLSHIKSTVLAAAKAAGIPDPQCRGGKIPYVCSANDNDPLVAGNVQVNYLLGRAENNYHPDAGGEVSFIQTYVPGGIEYGSALVAGAWMVTWGLLDAYAPVTTVSTSPDGPDGSNGWYRQPVTVTLSATGSIGNLDTGPFVTNYSLNGGTTQVYSTPFTISTEGVHQISYYSVDSKEITEEVHQLTVQIDLTPPVVDVWLDQPGYTRTEPFIVHFSGSDAVSGFASLTAEFNGQAVTDGQAVDLLWLPLGDYSLTVRGEDVAGWVTVNSQTIKLYATLDGMQATVDRLCQEKFITKQGTCKELSDKLKAVSAVMGHRGKDYRGNFRTAVNVLRAFQNAVNAQAGKAITNEAAALLLGESDYVMKHLIR